MVHCKTLIEGDHIVKQLYHMRLNVDDKPCTVIKTEGAGHTAKDCIGTQDALAISFAWCGADYHRRGTDVTDVAKVQEVYAITKKGLAGSEVGLRYHRHRNHWYWQAARLCPSK